MSGCSRRRSPYVPVYPLEVLSDTIQPFPSFSGIFDSAFKALRLEIASMPPPAHRCSAGGTT